MGRREAAARNVSCSIQTLFGSRAGNLSLYNPNFGSRHVRRAVVMKRALLLILILGACLASAQSAFAVQGGYDEATRKLEAGFKIVATERIASDNECYPAPDEVAAVLRREMG